MNQIIKPKRSISLSEDEINTLKVFHKRFPTEVELALKIGIDRNVLSRVIQVGSGSQNTVTRIRKFLKRETNLALN